eukprot:6041142-Pyramimonas_sp.AAC.2
MRTMCLLTRFSMLIVIGRRRSTWRTATPTRTATCSAICAPLRRIRSGACASVGGCCARGPEGALGLHKAVCACVVTETV